MAIRHSKPRFVDVMAELVPQVAYQYNPVTLEITSWDESGLGTKQPTQAEIDAKTKEMEDAYDKEEYARHREDEYPDWGDQLNKIYDDGVDKWNTVMVDAVKAKWPKDNSGPK